LEEKLILLGAVPSGLAQESNNPVVVTPVSQGGRSAGVAAKYRCRAEDHSSISPKDFTVGQGQKPATVSPELPQISGGKKNATGNYGA